MHLIKPLGFSLDDRYLKRAGLDYWRHLKLHIHENFDDLIDQYRDGRFLFFSVRGRKLYTDIEYKGDDFLVFGSETNGFPQGFLRKDQIALRLPMRRDIKRSLNLSNTVAIAVYEALRQQGYPRMR